MEVLKSLLFNSKGGNFENQRFWTAISFILNAFFFLKFLAIFSSLNVHDYHLT